jgi:hypothetical protein
MKEKFGPTILFLILICGGFCATAPAQSGRTTPSPTPAPETAVLPDPKNESPPCVEERGEVVILHTLELARLADELNELGGCGYRVEDLFRSHADAEETARQSKFGVYLKRDRTNKHQYAWFLARRAGEAQTLANELAEKGYYFKKIMPFVEGACLDSTYKRSEPNKESNAAGGFLGGGFETGAIFPLRKPGRQP